MGLLAGSNTRRMHQDEEEEEEEGSSGSQSDEEMQETGKTSSPSRCRRFMECCRNITVEPVCFFYQFAIVSQVTINNEYIVQAYNDQYVSMDSNYTSTEGEPSPGEIMAATKSANFISVLNLLSTIPPLLTVYFFGAFSDVVGRKPVILFPVTGLLLALVVNLLIVHYGLTTNLFLLTTFLIYGSGGHLVLDTVLFAYLGDITTVSSNRTTRFLNIKLSEVLALTIGQIVGGELITYCGYFYAELVMFISSLCSVLYAIFFVKDSKPRVQEDTPWKKCAILKKLPTMLWAKDGTPYRRLKIFVFSYLVFIQSIYNSGGMITLMLFLINPPVSMTPELVGYFLVEFLFTRLVGTVAIVFIQRKLTSDHVVIAIGLISAIAGTLGLSVPCYNYIYIFLVPFLGFASSSFDTVCRSAMSKLVCPTDQGAMSAWATLVAALAGLIGATLFPYIYSLTYGLYIPAVFCVGSAIYATGILLLLMLYITTGRGKSSASKDDREESVSAPLIAKTGAEP